MAMAEFMDEYGDEEKLFLEFVLGHYIDEGVGELDSTKLPQLLELKYGSPRDAVNVLGDAGKIREMFIGFQRLLYAKGQTA
jgi:type I restriction enzyme R subunit